MNTNKKKLLAIGLILLLLLVGGGIVYYVSQLSRFRGDVRQRASETQGNWIGSPECSVSFAIASPTPIPTIPPTATATPTATLAPTATATPTATLAPTATPSPECNSSCATDAECANGTDSLVCYIPNGETEGNCRLSSNPESPICAEPTTPPTNTPTPPPTFTSTPTPTPPLACNDSCTQGDQCPDGLICWIGDDGNGNCRLSSNPGNTLCSPPTATPTVFVPTKAPAPTYLTATPTNTPTPKALPEAGFSLPGFAVFGGGLVMAIVGILLAL